MVKKNSPGGGWFWGEREDRSGGAIDRNRTEAPRGGGGLFYLHTYKLPSNAQEKKSLIYNYKVLPYTISPIAKSDLVL